MGAVEEVFAAEQGGVLVEQGRLQAAQIVGHAIDLLLGVVLSQPNHILWAIDDVRLALLQIDKAPIIAPAQIDAGERMQGDNLPEGITDLEQAGVAELQVVVHIGGDDVALLLEPAGHHIAARHQDRPVVGVGTCHLRQPLAVDGRLVIFPVGIEEHPRVIGHPGRGVDGLCRAEHHRWPRE
ncbi:hypothetical protein V428_20365 [Aeromonas hydrophila subsp. hydrophila AL09-71]|nr:hypothetical protein V428_20365 [Aeromonas hydrophila subsp. hydrophila AL09-71]AHX71095.1 hypothetical protein V429_20400 [Aeromonas hydrophila pc104A]